jgi:hypothetical protein
MQNNKEFEQQVLDTKILQKVNAAHREAFVEKLPGQADHILRLITERLQLGLDKRGGVVVTDPNTWILTPAEIEQLAQAMLAVYTICTAITGSKNNDRP